jgi:hypothetical protein
MPSRVLVLPGSSSPLNARFSAVFAGIESEAKRRGFEYQLVLYPGQNGRASGLMSYSSTLAQAAVLCDRFQPDWLIGRSFGCCVAAGLLASCQPWVRNCVGAVMWGPCLPATVKRIWPTDEDRRSATRKYAEERNTYWAPDFLEVFPAIEQLVRNSASNLRIARGTLDEYNTLADLNLLEAVHQQGQPAYHRIVKSLDGLPHEVVPDELTPTQRQSYFETLFSPIR